MTNSLATKLQEKNTPYLAFRSAQPRHTILIFDSGVGGLSVYENIRQLLPYLHYLYVFDNVFFPYGEKNEALIIKRVVKILSAIQHHYPLSIAIIACNTASIVSLPILRKKFHFPVVGVVPAIKPATYLTKNGVIGLLATRLTVKHPYTRRLIDRFANAYQIAILYSTELVKLAEAKTLGNMTSLEELRCILHPWLYMPRKPDTVILGCTHFPLLKDELLQVFPKGVTLVDSGAAVARRTAWLLKHQTSNAKSSYANVAFYTANTQDTEKLFPIFYHHNFSKLEKLLL